MELQPVTPSLSQNRCFKSRVTYKFDRQHWKTIGHFILATWSFVHNFITIGKFNMELQSVKAKLGQDRKFLSSVTLKFDG